MMSLYGVCVCGGVRVGVSTSIIHACIMYVCVSVSRMYVCKHVCVWTCMYV